MNFINEMTEKIKEAKIDKEIKDTLLYVAIAVQMDSSIRKEFDEYNGNQNI